MAARIQKGLLWVGLPLLVLAGGCGNYNITFEVADVINAPGPDVTREMLDVDILCLTRKEVERHPEIVNGTMRADEWFKARDEDSPRIGDIPPQRIYSLRRGEAGNRRDTLVGPPLLSFVDRKDGRRTTKVAVHHPAFLNDQSAIVIYGRFSDPTGIAKTPPLVLQPPPRWKTDLKIQVGRRDMQRVE